MKASQLRDLTRDYAADKIGQEEYLAERTRLIDGIVAGEIEIRYHDIEPSQPPDTTRRQWWYGAAGAALVGLLMVALVAHFLVDSPGSSAPRQPAKATTPPSPGVQLLGRFDVNGDWSDESLEHVESTWRSLTVFQREDARRSAEYRRLKHETTRRIREQEALMAAGEMDALVQAMRLRKFGERLGFVAD